MAKTTVAQYFINGNGIKNLLLNLYTDNDEIPVLPSSTIEASYVMTNAGELNGQSNHVIKEWSVTYLNSRIATLSPSLQKFFTTVDPTISYTLTRKGDGSNKTFSLRVNNAIEIGSNNNTKVTQNYTVVPLF